MSKKMDFEAIGQWFFKYRDFTPIPLIILLLIFSSPSILTATLGTLVIISGELIRVYSVAFIGSISRTRKDRTGGNLVDSGPFGLVRNPLYVGNFFITMGFSVFGGNLYIAILGFVLFSVQYFFIVKYEENLLRQEFGDKYETYCKTVPPWYPRRKVRLEKLEWPTNFSPAIKSERRTLTTIGALLLLLSFI